MMKSIKTIILSLCTVLVLTGCTGSSNEKHEVQSQIAWQRYEAAFKTKDLQRTLTVIDSMEQVGIIGDARADYMRALAYDQGWQMRIAEHYYKKAYEGYGAEPSQDWYLYGDAGYRWACMRFLRGDTDGALSVTSDLLAQVEENDSFPKRIEASLLMLMAEAQMQLHQNDEARLTWQKAYEAQQQVGAKTQQPNLPYVSMNISTGLFEMGDIEGAQEWLERCAQEFAVFEQIARDSLLKEEWRGHIALKRARYLHASGHTEEAAVTYAAVPRSRIFEPHGYTEAAEYLMAAGRYKEAAYWYDQLDSTYLATDGRVLMGTFDGLIAFQPKQMHTEARNMYVHFKKLFVKVTLHAENTLLFQCGIKMFAVGIYPCMPVGAEDLFQKKFHASCLLILDGNTPVIAEFRISGNVKAVIGNVTDGIDDLTVGIIADDIKINIFEIVGLEVQQFETRKELRLVDVESQFLSQYRHGRIFKPQVYIFFFKDFDFFFRHKFHPCLLNDCLILF